MSTVRINLEGTLLSLLMLLRLSVYRRFWYVGTLTFWKLWNLFYHFRDLDPAPNPPYFPSYVIKATLDYIGSCYKTKSKELIAILSKNPVSNWYSTLWQCGNTPQYIIAFKMISCCFINYICVQHCMFLQPF